MRKKKQPTTRVPRVRGAGKYTEGQFWAFIRATLRNASRYWKPIANARKNARRAYKGKNSRQKWEYKCAICGNYFPIHEIEVDHIIPAGKLSCAADLPGFVERLFVEEEGLQVVCKTVCHPKKTKDEKE